MTPTSRDEPLTSVMRILGVMSLEILTGARVELTLRRVLALMRRIMTGTRTRAISLLIVGLWSSLRVEMTLSFINFLPNQWRLYC